jgi:peroxin-6
MLEPVLQGFARAGFTRFYVASDNASNEESSPQDKMEFESGEESGSDPDAVEIDESFFVSSILQSRQNPLSSGVPEAVADGLQHTNGESGNPTTFHLGCRLRTEPLPEPVSISQDDYTLYLRTSDLGRVGVLDGDWVGSFLRWAYTQKFILTLRQLSAHVRHRIIDLFEYLAVTT